MSIKSFRKSLYNALDVVKPVIAKGDLWPSAMGPLARIGNFYALGSRQRLTGDEKEGGTGEGARQPTAIRYGKGSVLRGFSPHDFKRLMDEGVTHCGIVSGFDIAMECYLGAMIDYTKLDGRLTDPKTMIETMRERLGDVGLVPLAHDNRISRLTLFVPGNSDKFDLEDLNNGTVAVEERYVNIVKQFFEQSGVNVTIKPLERNVEVVLIGDREEMGIYDSAVSITETGRTGKKLGLRRITDVMPSVPFVVADARRYEQNSSPFDDLGELYRMASEEMD